VAERAEVERIVIRRVRIAIRGAVQGVGFRPFVYRLASELSLSGWVLNSPQGVFIEAEAGKPALESFLLRLEKEKPPLAFVQSLEFSFLDPVGLQGFEIRKSSAEGDITALVLPDIATCGECFREIMDPHARRYRYPFANCTNCGPRFTIIESLPYDRAHTSMKAFEMCAVCRHEYEDPGDRRFHAQPIACWECGPQLALWDHDGRPLSSRDEALVAAAASIRQGKIVAVKGLGGFHLAVDARSEAAVARLRTRKRREEKPLALMLPGMAAVREVCRISPLEERLLLAPESPIVLLERRGGAAAGHPIAQSVAPNNPYLGIMLPYTPLHHLLMRELGFPVVATSGNLSDEPICTDEAEALQRLQGIADLFLVHNRPVARHVDDSIARVMLGRELILRRARGYAPLPCSIAVQAPPVLAVGGHLKNTVALARAGQVFISQHIGDLETKEAFAAFLRVAEDLSRLYHTVPEQIAADMHPDYLSTRYAQTLGKPALQVQHHYAHVAACMAENELRGPVLGVSWDGAGYGTDGTIWGGEFLQANETSFVRLARFRHFRLPGAERAVREPRRTALGVLYEILAEQVFDMRDLPPIQSFGENECALLRQMLVRNLNSPVTSSAGRLFDAVASLAGLRQTIRFEGQAAMELEFALPRHPADERYPYRVVETGAAECAWVADWEPMMRAILDDCRAHVPAGNISARFHNTLAEIILEVAKRAKIERVVLTGGCFQNRYLTERSVRRLEAEGFKPYWHQRVPPNDGGISLGQAFVAVNRSLQKG